MMNREAIIKWIEALESGEYKQGYGVLRDSEDTSHFCCLGVACDISGVGTWRESFYVTGFDEDGTYSEGEAFLPIAVAKHLFQENLDGPEFSVVLDTVDILISFDIVQELVSDNIKLNAEQVAKDGDCVRVTALNDQGVPFTTIAKMLRMTFLGEGGDGN